MSIERDTTQEPGGRDGIHELMPFQTREILLVASRYDTFILEEDGRFSDRLFSEYMELRLHFLPRMTRASTGREALQLMETRQFDLVITAPRLLDIDVATFATRAKCGRPDLPIAVLAQDGLAAAHAAELASAGLIDRVFVWRGDNRLLVTMVKSIEDMRNADHDTARGDVRAVLLVEDSAPIYSALLPVLFTEIMEQTQALIAEGVNHVDRLWRMVRRPKILLATSVAEAKAIYARYERYMLGVISDGHLSSEGAKTEMGEGLRFLLELRAQRGDLPLLLQSADDSLAPAAEEAKVAFLQKGDEGYLSGISAFVRDNFGFGDFVFRMPDGDEVARATNVFELMQRFTEIPDDALQYHAERNHISLWLMARGEFDIAHALRPITLSDFPGLRGARDYIVQTLDGLLEKRQRGQLSEFERGGHHLRTDFSRLGGGSLGGKGRSAAFIYTLLAGSDVHERFEGVRIVVPRTTVVCTEEFERYVQDNGLVAPHLEADTDTDIADRFLHAPISKDVQRDLESMLEAVRYPLAVRSSSQLEDSWAQPFAGVYRTYMLPNNDDSLRVRIRQLRRAIKLIYASTFFASAREYMSATGHQAGEERMAVLIQQLIGAPRGDRFYPTASGVAQSHNFYPIGPMRAADGVANVALGLGRTVVSGGRSLRFSPAHPRVLPQLSSPSAALRNTQRKFYALDMAKRRARITLNDTGTLTRPDISIAEADEALGDVASTYDANDDRIFHTVHRPGARVLTFAPMLVHETFPLAPILTAVLELAEEGMGCPVEIEFAVETRPPDGGLPIFAVLQARPLVRGRLEPEVDLDAVPPEAIVIRSTRALGNGRTPGLIDVVYVAPDSFDPSRTREMAQEVEEINATIAETDRSYVLVGPGRWGTSDPFLGVPVRWAQVSAARVIVEVARPGYDKDPSQGTHFFHNVTSLNVAYLNVDGRREGELIDWTMLNALPDIGGKRYVRHVRLERPLCAYVDGTRGVAVLMQTDVS